MLRVILYLLITHCSQKLTAGSSSDNSITTVFEWRRLPFAYCSDAKKQKDIESGFYKPDAPLPIDVDVYYHSLEPMVFVTTPRFNPGVPATLGYVLDKEYEGDPVVQPFPSWKWHRYTNITAEQCPKRLISVLRVKIDRCGYIWILDSGSDNSVIICPPKIVMFDLKKWPRVKSPQYVYEYPKEVYTNESLFATIDVDTRGRNCRATRYAYVADITAFGLVVTDLIDRTSRRIESPSMRPQENYTDIEILGNSIDLDTDGIVGLSIYPRGGKPYRQNVYYSPLAGVTESRINLADLNKDNDPHILTYPTPRSNQSIAMDINKDGIAFFGITSDVSINCWNVKSKDYGNNIHPVYKNPVTMQFPSGIKILTNPADSEELWIMTNRMQTYGSQNFSDVNYRVSKGNVALLLKNSKCQYPNM